MMLIIINLLFIYIFQLYEIDDNPKRKEFLDELFTMMQKRGKKINWRLIICFWILEKSNLLNNDDGV
jgi:hypothetical protein